MINDPAGILKLFTNEAGYTCKCGREVENIPLGEFEGQQRYGRKKCDCQKPVKATQKSLPLEDPKYPRQNGFMPEEDLSDMPY